MCSVLSSKGPLWLDFLKRPPPERDHKMFVFWVVKSLMKVRLYKTVWASVINIPYYRKLTLHEINATVLMNRSSFTPPRTQHKVVLLVVLTVFAQGF